MLYNLPPKIKSVLFKVLAHFLLPHRHLVDGGKDVTQMELCLKKMFGYVLKMRQAMNLFARSMRLKIVKQLQLKSWLIVWTTP